MDVPDPRQSSLGFAQFNCQEEEEEEELRLCTRLLCNGKCFLRLLKNHDDGHFGYRTVREEVVVSGRPSVDCLFN